MSNEKPEVATSYHEQITALHQAIMLLQNIIDPEDPAVSIKNIEARAQVLTATRLLSKLPNEQTETIKGLKNELVRECLNGLHAIQPLSRNTETAKTKALAIIEQIKT